MTVEELERRIAELEELICEASPIRWACFGPPAIMHEAWEWEKKAEKLLRKESKTDGP